MTVINKVNDDSGIYFSYEFRKGFVIQCGKETIILTICFY